MNIIGNKVYLRALEKEDMEAFRVNANNPDIEYAVGGWSFPISTTQQYKWYEHVSGDNSNLRLTIADKVTDEILGMINLVNIDWKSGCAFTGIRLFDNCPKKKGYGKDAVFAIMEYAFNELRLHRLEGSIIETNIASQKLYEKCGWVVEGVKREAVFKNGKYYNELQVAILKEEYERVKDEQGDRQ